MCAMKAFAKQNDTSTALNQLFYTFMLLFWHLKSYAWRAVGFVYGEYGVD